MTRRWPLLLIATPAAVAIWSGWVGLGQLCGFGTVRLLPGITDWTLDTAITLPIGVEAYAAFALGVWMGGSEKAKRFAMWSALGALAYGMLGQVVYHLLAAAHVTAAPWPIVVMVSCMPVIVLGFAAALTHLLAAKPGTPERSVSVPGLRPLMREVGIGQEKARKVQEIIVKHSSPAGAAAPPGAPAGVNGRAHG